MSAYDSGVAAVPKAERVRPGFAIYLYWFHFANGTFMASGHAEVIKMISGNVGGAIFDTLQA